VVYKHNTIHTQIFPSIPHWCFLSFLTARNKPMGYMFRALAAGLLEGISTGAAA
jgi:hypothetical protein